MFITCEWLTVREKRYNLLFDLLRGRNPYDVEIYTPTTVPHLSVIFFTLLKSITVTDTSFILFYHIISLTLNLSTSVHSGRILFYKLALWTYYCMRLVFEDPLVNFRFLKQFPKLRVLVLEIFFTSTYF